MRIKQLLKEGTDFLGNRENALLDCEVLLGHVLGVAREYLIAHDSDSVESVLFDLFQKYLARVRDGEPVSYITNTKEFFGLDFFVDGRVLVPRPETEHLVEKVLKFLGDRGTARILDVGTGSGNIAIAIGKNIDTDQIDAVDISEDALEVAKINVEQHGLSDRIHVFQSDLLDSIEDDTFYDVIVANLPYIGEVKNRYISADAQKHEPEEALFGGYDGLGLYKKMFQRIVGKGIGFDFLIGEFGFAQGNDMRKMLDKYFEHKWLIESDLAGIDRLFIVKS